jgi:hypothetical protein
MPRVTIFFPCTDQIQAKISKTREQIKVEQNSKEANVDEYLRYRDGTSCDLNI